MLDGATLSGARLSRGKLSGGNGGGGASRSVAKAQPPLAIVWKLRAKLSKAGVPACMPSGAPT